MGCFSSREKEKPTSEKVNQDKIDEAILDLKVIRDKLKKYQKQQEHCKELEMQKARQFIQNKQLERAKIVLRQKKAREVFIQNAEKTLSNIETQINNVETKQMELEVLNNLKQTNDILKHMNDLMPVEEVERIMDENQDQADRLNEIGDLLAQNMSPADAQAADEDYEAMLAELEAENKAEAGEAMSESAESESSEKEKPQKQKVAMPA